MAETYLTDYTALITVLGIHASKPSRLAFIENFKFGHDFAFMNKGPGKNQKI